MTSYNQFLLIFNFEIKGFDGSYMRVIDGNPELFERFLNHLKSKSIDPIQAYHCSHIEAYSDIYKPEEKIKIKTLKSEIEAFKLLYGDDIHYMNCQSDMLDNLLETFKNYEEDIKEEYNQEENKK